MTLLKIDNSIPVSLIKFGLVAKIRSTHKEDSFVTWVGLLITWLYPHADVKELIFSPSALSLSRLHHLDNFALKSPVVAERVAFTSFTLDSSKFRSLQNSSNSS